MADRLRCGAAKNYQCSVSPRTNHSQSPQGSAPESNSNGAGNFIEQSVVHFIAIFKTERQQTNKSRILKNSHMSFCRCPATSGKQTAVAQITMLQIVKNAQPMLVVLYWPLLNSLVRKVCTEQEMVCEFWYRELYFFVSTSRKSAIVSDITGTTLNIDKEEQFMCY